MQSTSPPGLLNGTVINQAILRILQVRYEVISNITSTAFQYLSDIQPMAFKQRRRYDRINEQLQKLRNKRMCIVCETNGNRKVKEKRVKSVMFFNKYHEILTTNIHASCHNHSMYYSKMLCTKNKSKILLSLNTCTTNPNIMSLIQTSWNTNNINDGKYISKRSTHLIWL